MGAAELSRDVDDYFALAFRRMLVKNFHVEAPGCNLGVNCAETGRLCGRLSISNATVPAPGQLAGDNVCGPGSFYEVFRNNTGAYCSPNCSMISAPGSGPNCESTFTTPILGDLDGDQQPSCDDDCTIDIGDVAAACGVAYPLPQCDPTIGVLAHPESDCVPAALDLVLGNQQCDLAAGTYGTIRVRNRGRINFGAGTTVACTLAVAKAARVTSAGPALILIPGDGWASFGNLSDVGGECRAFKVVTESGPVRFGKHGEFHLDACSLAGTLKLGHDNNLRGRFVSGEFIVSNYNNTGACCVGTTTSTSTTTSTISSTTTSTTLPGSVCCADTTQEPPLCGSAPTAGDCLEGGGIPGPAGSVCQADPEGGGRCADAPPNPGGCCQFEGACALGGTIGEITCSSLGGAFVADAICDPDGNCLPVTTSTTVTTVTTVTSVTVTTSSTVVTTSSTVETTSSTTEPSTTTTSTSSTSTTTNPPLEVCCELTGEEPPLCGSAATAADCLEAGGTAGPAGSTCEADGEGGGRCTDGPPNPGGCCQFEGACAIGGGIDEVACSSLGGAFVADAVCSPSGSCGPPTTSTTSTTVTTVTTTSSVTTVSTSSTVTTITTTSTVTTVTTLKTTSTSSTTSTTNTTVPGPVCCEHKAQVPWVCDSAPSAKACKDSGGTPGNAGEVCQISPQGGFCDAPPPPPGGCCQKVGRCSIGALNAERCEDLGGTFVTDAQCLPDGNCTSVPDSDLGFTRTIGFYKTHPAATQWVLDQADGISVCGVELTNVDDDDAHSALEALCLSPKGDQRLQLVRQLTAAALTMALEGGATFGDFEACNTLCANGTGSVYELGDCINSADNFNNSGDYLPAPFDGIDNGAPDYCRLAYRTPCNILDPERCDN